MGFKSHTKWSSVRPLRYGRVNIFFLNRAIERLPKQLLFYGLFGIWHLFITIISWIYMINPEDFLDTFRSEEFDYYFLFLAMTSFLFIN